MNKKDSESSVVAARLSTFVFLGSIALTLLAISLMPTGSMRSIPAGERTGVAVAAAPGQLALVEKVYIDGTNREYLYHYQLRSNGTNCFVLVSDRTGSPIAQHVSCVRN